jgi:hypothetical protein
VISIKLNKKRYRALLQQLNGYTLESQVAATLHDLYISKRQIIEGAFADVLI